MSTKGIKNVNSEPAWRPFIEAFPTHAPNARALLMMFGSSGMMSAEMYPIIRPAVRTGWVVRGSWLTIAT